MSDYKQRQRSRARWQETGETSLYFSNRMTSLIFMYRLIRWTVLPSGL